jgi:cytoskeletal protein CcmA (bactofilin family)
MAKRGPHVVQCYHCQHRFEVGGKAQSTSCPRCHKPLIVEDVIVKQLRVVSKLQTTGKLVIQKKGRVIAKSVVTANEGIQVVGNLDANEVLSGGPVVIGPRATWKGSLTAPSIEVKPGAKVLGGNFHVPADPLEVSDLNEQNATNGNGRRR